jgi:hypothetical protein
MSFGRSLRVEVVGDLAGWWVKATAGVDFEAVDQVIELLDEDEEAMELYADVPATEAPRVLRELQARAQSTAPIALASCSRTASPRSRGTSRAPRARRGRSGRGARSNGRRTDDDPHKLGAQLAGLIGEYGLCSACSLAREVGRRKADVLEALRLGPFEQVGRGRAAKWAVVPVPAVLVRYRDEVWKARRRGLIDADETLELLIDPKPRVLEMLAEVAA